ncbi:LacI family DNA-binding transcriptional regulator [Microbacterium ureisolvens]|uniref:LacI family DNA-binding transcriptional regulator n=1 Tax=Microbacterium ureisolvens TaxID=2781186 RepID=A0ABS7HUN9_9MICO|nr:LacI family DNA-binding transcriptional regulator [Microbacterium ureisolvens]MBW9109074.1 LacI family DNA-binding transcriptional regulator [Microbacterium ureisolvens]
MPRPPRADRSTRVTIADVAARAGVSLSTVSRALNGNPTVDPALAERVKAAADALDYTASPVARSLVLGRTQTVAVIVPDLGNPTFQAILRGLSHAAAADDYHVLVADSAESVEEERVLAGTTRRRTDGVILCAPRLPQDELDRLVGGLRPVVLINRTSGEVPSVGADYRTALSTELAHLHELGHRRIVFLAGAPGSVANTARLDAIAAFVAEHPDTEVAEIPCGVDFEAGAAAGTAVRASGATAAVAFNDLVAMGLLSAVQADGCRVPDDLSIVGFDDIPFARYTTPPLTTAAVPATELGAQAWARMRELLEGAEPGHPLTVLPELTIRGTTGRART